MQVSCRPRVMEHVAQSNAMHVKAMQCISTGTLWIWVVISFPLLMSFAIEKNNDKSRIAPYPASVLTKFVLGDSLLLSASSS